MKAVSQLVCKVNYSFWLMVPLILNTVIPPHSISPWCLLCFLFVCFWGPVSLWSLKFEAVPCLSFPSTGIMGVNHHTWLSQCNLTCLKCLLVFISWKYHIWLAQSHLLVSDDFLCSCCVGTLSDLQLSYYEFLPCGQSQTSITMSDCYWKHLRETPDKLTFLGIWIIK